MPYIPGPSVSITQNTATPMFNSSLSLTCAYTSTQPVTTVQWFINGRPVAETSGTADTSTTLVVDNLRYYQCFVLTENGDNDGASLLVSAQRELTWWAAQLGSGTEHRVGFNSNSIGFFSLGVAEICEVIGQ